MLGKRGPTLSSDKGRLTLKAFRNVLLSRTTWIDSEWLVYLSVLILVLRPGVLKDQVYRARQLLSIDRLVVVNFEAEVTLTAEFTVPLSLKIYPRGSGLPGEFGQSFFTPIKKTEHAILFF